MKTKFLSFIFALCFVFPCAFLFSACGDNAPTAQEIVAEVNNQQYTVENGKLYFDYGEPISFNATDFVVSVVYSDGTRQRVESSQVDAYTIEWNHSSTEILNDGTYNLRIVYQDFAFNFDVVVTKKVSAIPVFATETITYNGQKQKPTIQNFDNINWQIIDIENAESYDEYGNVNAGNYTLTLSLKDKQKTSWVNGSTDDISLDWQIGQKQVQIPTADLTKATFNDDTLYYEVSYAFNSETFVGVEQAFSFVDLSSDIIVSGGSATNVGQYTATLSLDNQNGTNNLVWAGESGASSTNPRMVRWEIVPYEFDLPEFGGNLTYRQTPFTFDELVDDAGLVNYYSIMQIGNMTNGVFNQVFMPNAGTPIQFSLPLDNVSFKWKDYNINTRTITVPLNVQKIVIDMSGVTFIPTGGNGSLTPVAGKQNVYTTKYTGATVDQMFTVEIPAQISSLVSYCSDYNKYIDASNVGGEPLVSVQNIGEYNIHIGFEFDDEIYQLSDVLMITVQIEKAQKVAGVDFTVPTYNTMLAHEFVAAPTLSDIGFGSVANTSLYSWKNSNTQLTLGQNSYRAVYTPLDTTNYDSTEFDVLIRYLCDIDFAILDSRYTGQAITLDVSNYLTPQIELVSSTEILTQTEVNNYNIVFAIKDEFKQTHCWIDATNQDKAFVWKIVKGVTTVPEFDNEIYHYVPNAESGNVTLADISLEGLVDSGSFAWADSTQSVALVSNENEPYSAIYTPQDSTHFETKQVSIYVYLYVEVPQVVLSNESSTFDGTQKTTTFNAYDTNLISFIQTDSASLVNQNAGEYDYYFNLTQNYLVWESTHLRVAQKLTYTINKRAVDLPTVAESAEYQIVDGVYTFVYKYTNEYQSIQQTLPLSFDNTFSQMGSGSVVQSTVGNYSATISLLSSENTYWNDLQHSTDDIVFNWEIVKAEAIDGIAAPLIPTVYKNYGIAAPLSQVEFADAGFSWEAPSTNLSLGTRNYVALYTPDADNISATQLNVSITFYQKIDRPTVLLWQTNYTGQSQTISNDSGFTQLGYYTWRLNTGSAATTQTDIGTYNLLFIPRNNFVWSDTLDTAQITFVWKIVGVSYSFFASSGDEQQATNSVVALDEGGRIVVNTLGYTVYYNLSSQVPTESVFDQSISVDGQTTVTVSAGTTDITFAVYNSSHEIIANYSISVLVGDLE